MKDFIIYEKGKTKVYINKNNKQKDRKLFTYSIRRDDKYGLAQFLGLIRFDGGWRQYITEFDKNTKWSSGCKKKICEFEDKLNLKWRKNLNAKTTN